MKRILFSILALALLAVEVRADPLLELAKEAVAGRGVARGRVNVRVGGLAVNVGRGFGGIGFNRGFAFRSNFGFRNRFAFHGYGFNRFAFRGYGYASAFHYAPAFAPYYAAPAYSAPLVQGYAAGGCPCSAEIAALSQQISDLAARLGVR